ncbi:hypothetical protein GCM10027565_20620 [Bordetella tumulicola]
MEDREHPGSSIAILASLMPALDSPFQAILNQIIGRAGIFHQRPGITPQCGNIRLYQVNHVLGHHISQIRAGVAALDSDNDIYTTLPIDG